MKKGIYLLKYFKLMKLFVIVNDESFAFKTLLLMTCAIRIFAICFLKF